MKGNPVSLLCLNIPSFSGGAGDVWGNCENKIGLMDEKDNKGPIKLNFHNLKFSDGEIEIISFNSVMGLGNERYNSALLYF